MMMSLVVFSLFSDGCHSLSWLPSRAFMLQMGATEYRALMVMHDYPCRPKTFCPFLFSDRFPFMFQTNVSDQCFRPTFFLFIFSDPCIDGLAVSTVDSFSCHDVFWVLMWWCHFLFHCMTHVYVRSLGFLLETALFWCAYMIWHVSFTSVLWYDSYVFVACLIHKCTMNFGNSAVSMRIYDLDKFSAHVLLFFFSRPIYVCARWGDFWERRGFNAHMLVKHITQHAGSPAVA